MRQLSNAATAPPREENRAAVQTVQTIHLTPANMLSIVFLLIPYRRCPGGDHRLTSSAQHLLRFAALRGRRNRRTEKATTGAARNPALRVAFVSPG